MKYNPNLAEQLNKEAELKKRMPNITAEQRKPEVNQVNIQDKESYIKIPNTNIIIARREILKGLNWNDTHSKLSEQGLFMPSIKTAMTYYNSVIQAHNNNTQLYNALNNPLSRDETEDLYKYLISNPKNGVWTWLDAFFPEENIIETDHRVIKGKLEGKRFNLEKCLTEDCYADLTFNSQGLPVTKSRNKNYKPGENIYFYHPKVRYVAGLGAGAVRSDLSCYWYASYVDADLGVLACAEGT